MAGQSQIVGARRVWFVRLEWHPSGATLTRVARLLRRWMGRVEGHPAVDDIGSEVLGVVENEPSQYVSRTSLLAWRDQRDDTFVVVHDVIVIAAPSFVFVGTVLRMWDSMAEADKFGEFAPRTSSEELHRLRIFFTLLDRRAHAATEDRELYYLRVAQGWFMLSVGAFLALVLAAAAAIGD